jgi:hypothetical protein
MAEISTTTDTGNVSRDTYTCSRVNDNGDTCGKPLDTTGYPLWCKRCRADHRKAYNATVKEMSESRGFAAGVQATKDLLASEFANSIRGIQISGFEAARLVRACRGPFIPN